MQLSSFLTPERTLCGAQGLSKKRALETASQFICSDVLSLNADDVFNKLIERERLGSTGLGNGIAIPHCRIDNCSQITGSLLKLENAVDFDAIDGEPVDLLFVLLVPDEAHDEHLAVLATLAERFSNDRFIQNLRQATSNDDLFNAAISR
ncbi:MAG: PTS system nitrogen regulatory IIA component [Pseudohongiellaceae bacterium]|jgi:PTS system nitrogen regulatory IIA component